MLASRFPSRFNWRNSEPRTRRCVGRIPRMSPNVPPVKLPSPPTANTAAKSSVRTA
ncbi:unnamed protein product, partial [Dibothriocephalus latus]